jgi:mRNA-degrading endonuclease toxin of MazEF toxin-antitoxin module
MGTVLGDEFDPREFYPMIDRLGGKNRPAVVVQNDRDNRRLATTIVAMISGNIQHADEATQLLIDSDTAEGSSSGLRGPSVVKCCNLFTISQPDIQRSIGHLSETMMTQLKMSLMAALYI